MNLTKVLDGELHSTKTNSRTKKQYHEENTIKITSKYLKEKKMFIEIVDISNIFFAPYSF